MKDWICAILGPLSWEELLAIEADIRKQKREHEWRRIELRQKIIEWVAGIFLFVICLGALVGLVLLVRSASQKHGIIHFILVLVTKCLHIFLSFSSNA